MDRGPNNDLTTMFGFTGALVNGFGNDGADFEWKGTYTDKEIRIKKTYMDGRSADDVEYVGKFNDYKDHIEGKVIRDGEEVGLFKLDKD